MSETAEQARQDARLMLAFVAELSAANLPVTQVTSLAVEYMRSVMQGRAITKYIKEEDKRPWE